MKLNPIRRVHIFIIVGLLALLPLWLQRYQKKSLPVYGQVTSFELTDAQGQTVTQNDLKGKVWVADFIFTTCPGPCPLLSKNMAAIHRSFKLLNDVRMVSLTVNPENDTPDVLKEYAKTYDADLSKWLFLTGDREQITRLLKDDFRAGHLQDIAFHSVYFVLVDDLLRIRGYYDTTDQKQLQQLVVDLAFQRKRSAKRQRSQLADKES